MSHRDRSIANMRCEAKRIYNQRRYINKLEKENQELIEKYDKLRNFIIDYGNWNGDELILDKINELERGGEKNR